MEGLLTVRDSSQSPPRKTPESALIKVRLPTETLFPLCLSIVRGIGEKTTFTAIAKKITTIGSS